MLTKSKGISSRGIKNQITSLIKRKMSNRISKLSGSSCIPIQKPEKGAFSLLYTHFGLALSLPMSFIYPLPVSSIYLFYFIFLYKISLSIYFSLCLGSLINSTDLPLFGNSYCQYHIRSPYLLIVLKLFNFNSKLFYNMC